MQRHRDLNRHMAGPDKNVVAHMEDARAMTQKYSLNVNGKVSTVEADDDMPLLYALRNDLGLNNPHFGCGLAQCGACTVHVDGKAIKSCTMFAVQADGADVLTIEGIASGDKLDPMQEAFWNEHGAQCGFCTPGMIMASKQILDRNPHPSDEEIREGLEGNICRCTGYQHIVNAVRSAAKAVGA